MTSVNQEDEFTEVARKRKKHKAISSPTLPALQKTGSSEPPPVTPARPKLSYKNKIISDHQWCRQKIPKLETDNGRIETVPP